MVLGSTPEGNYASVEEYYLISIKVGLVAMVLGSPPEGNYASVEKYYQLICPQIIDILHNQVRNGNLFFIHIVFSNF